MFMKRNDWKLRAINNRFSVDLVTMHKDTDGIVTSLGLGFLDGKKVCSVEVVSDDFWVKPRKKQIPKKQILYFLAHQIALLGYADGIRGTADKHVMEWCGLQETTAVRRARNNQISKHLRAIGCESAVPVCCLDEMNNKEFSALLLDHSVKDDLSIPFEYSGRFYLLEKTGNKLSSDDLELVKGTLKINYIK